MFDEQQTTIHRHAHVHGWISCLWRVLTRCSCETFDLSDVLSYGMRLFHANSTGKGKLYLLLFCDSEIVCKQRICRIEERGREKMPSLFFSGFCIHKFLGISRRKIMQLKRNTDVRSATLRLPDVLSNRKISFHANSEGNGQLHLHLLLDSEVICELGVFRIKEYGEVKMQHLLFSRLCIHTFLGLSDKNIMELKEVGNGNKDIETLMEMDIAPRSIEPSIYKQALNKLFYGTCYFHLHPDSETELKKLSAETLHIIRPVAAEDLVRALASKFTRIRLKYGRDNIKNDFNISYSSNLDRVWTVHCFCPRVSMEREIQFNEMKSPLDHALSYHQLECRVDFRPQVKFRDDSVDVEIKIKYLRCGAYQLDPPDEPIESTLRKERYVPVKIIATMGSERGTATTVASASNLAVSYSQTKIQTEIDIAARHAKNWHFEASAADNRQGSFKWTLFHHSYPEKPVYSYSPKSRSDKYKAFQGLLRAVGPTSPFTEGGAVEFAEDMYGTPIKWSFHKSVRGKTLDWFVECEIWLAYYSTNSMEIRHQKFRQVLQLPMKRSGSFK